MLFIHHTGTQLQSSEQRGDQRRLPSSLHLNLECRFLRGTDCARLFLSKGSAERSSGQLPDDLPNGGHALPGDRRRVHRSRIFALPERRLPRVHRRAQPNPQSAAREGVRAGQRAEQVRLRLSRVAGLLQVGRLEPGRPEAASRTDQVEPESDDSGEDQETTVHSIKLSGDQAVRPSHDVPWKCRCAAADDGIGVELRSLSFDRALPGQEIQTGGGGWQ